MAGENSANCRAHTGMSRKHPTKLTRLLLIKSEVNIKTSSGPVTIVRSKTRDRTVSFAWQKYQTSGAAQVSALWCQFSVLILEPQPHKAIRFGCNQVELRSNLPRIAVEASQSANLRRKFAGSFALTPHTPSLPNPWQGSPFLKSFN